MYSGKQAVCDQLAHGPMDKIILQLVDSFKELSLPVRSIQLDDWCESGNAGPFCHSWTAVQDGSCVRVAASLVTDSELLQTLEQGTMERATPTRTATTTCACVS